MSAVWVGEFQCSHRLSKLFLMFRAKDQSTGGSSTRAEFGFRGFDATLPT
jgi:hypothetical protein